MTVNTEKNGNTLNVYIEGRIDTITAPQLENKLLSDIGDSTNLNIDFSEVEYISSAGLRVLLIFAQKIQSKKGKIQAINVNETIRKIFNLTGFLEILNVK